MSRRKRLVILCCVILMGLFELYGCSSPSSDSGITAVSAEMTDSQAANSEAVDEEAIDDERAGANRTGLIYESSMELQYAQNFSIDYYEGGYTFLTVMDGSRFLVVPEGKEIPEGMEKNIVILQRPIENLYLVASAAMDMFYELEALDTIILSGQKEEGWYIEAAKEAMARGDILYAGKYNKPDYELIVSKKCMIAIENTMISHSPEVIEKLQDFDVPVMIEYSSYESHPLGRVEWIKFFGALLGKEEQAQQVFAEQEAILERVTQEKTAGEAAGRKEEEKTVAFFFITSNGMIQVRQSSDYIPKMIELAGGRYIFEELGEEDSKRSTMNMQMEEFYNSARDADFILYNSAIDGGVSSMEELLDKWALLEDFKAVQEGNVWCTTNDMYQQSMSIGYLIEDIHTMLAGDEDEKEMRYLFRLQ